MDIQIIAVIAILAAALLYAGVSLGRKIRAFSVKKNCGGDCGCNGQSKNLIS